MELLSPMVVMLEGLGFNLCVAPFLKKTSVSLICLRGSEWKLSEVVRVGSEVSYWSRTEGDEGRIMVRTKASEDLTTIFELV